jgi:hypothetical protein
VAPVLLADALSVALSDADPGPESVPPESDALSAPDVAESAPELLSDAVASALSDALALLVTPGSPGGVQPTSTEPTTHHRIP